MSTSSDPTNIPSSLDPKDVPTEPMTIEDFDWDADE